ncbi:xanthine dehydrogenase family protein molybdopterin-binding subunit [Sphingosinicella microcystinivorans]|uniref:xanthine dehydrogenase family protein molybdopterin-binding subunit n=1 Tax=Sphingosinicella microcystinivorans TaxID=335406 RepID=UPI0022F3D3C9|nr:xanthine dehydrogenase family protein molybdopterin-binding subunit [Sphingosinicella microcystinivorans]WBX85776.1 xanthine dehydrogenase family protein molybdopterin-binding subunit [Sphingosinicella microcystinivorans]
MKAEPFDNFDNISRRGLIGAGGAFVLALGLPRMALAQTSEAPRYGADGQSGGWRDDPALFVAIGENGTVTITCHRAEMGQGIRTSLAMVIADELEADWSRVHVAQAVGDEARYGNQNTDGSRSMRHLFMPLRRCGAAARTMLEQAAAARWGVNPGEVAASLHEVIHRPTGRKLGYGALAKDAAALVVPDRAAVTLKTPAQFRYIGHAVPSADGVAITTGCADYGIDARLPDMLYAVIARPPVYGGKTKSVDKAAAFKVPGVVDIVDLPAPTLPSAFQPLGGVAVLAANTWAAMRGREALTITWDDGPNAAYNSAAYRAELERSARAPGQISRSDGDAEGALGKAAKRIEAEYYIPHLAQAPMEPPMALALTSAGRCEAWACTQDPQAARDLIAEALKIPVADVTIHQTLLGGGFGRKSKPDYVLEAALLSRAAKGRPVKVVWTREDDLHHSYFHTVSVERLEGGLDAAGRTVAWRHRSAAPSIGSIFGPDPKHQLPFEQGMGLRNVAFAIPDFRAETCAATAHTRIGWFRSVSNIPHCFAVQSFVAELAAAAGRDPKDYLLELIGPDRTIDPRAMGDTTNYGEDPARYPVETARLKAVIEAAAKGIGWGRKLAASRGLGIAAHYSFVTYTACAIEVSVTNGQLTVERADIAVDCGPQVNPDRIRSQMEGSVVMGISLATLGEISFRDGRVQQDNFDGYEVTRIDAAPKITEVHLVGGSAWDAPPGGVGEPGLPPVAPALCNAIHAATGKRIRALPIKDQINN